jgi:hypothetical protein
MAKTPESLPPPRPCPKCQRPVTVIQVREQTVYYRCEHCGTHGAYSPAERSHAHA